jgi:hypothetical protein
VIDALAYVTIAAALGLAVWGGIAAALGRAPDRPLYGGAAVVAGLIAVQAIIAVSRLIAGAEINTWLFIGYLLTGVLLLPCAAMLARLEPTRWGSVILAAGGVVLAPLVLRLIQIWELGRRG